MAFNYRAQSNPTSQQAKPQASMQASTQPTQQPSPSKAPDMSVYAQPAYNSSNVPRTPPKGAQQNDLSGQVPSNQIWAQAYNQASKQYGGNTQAQSFTMPGTFTSQGYNPTTGQYGQMTGGQSNAGNMAYNAIDQRPGPIQASATGVDGSQMPWQDTLRQGEAFVGNLSQRLGQYSGGQLTGPVTFDQGQLMQQANDQLANGSFYNPFSQQNAMQNPDVQRAMGNATQYMQGNFQNPFGNSPAANTPRPSLSQESYDPFGPQGFGADQFYVRPPAQAPGEFDWMNDRSLNQPRISGQPGRRSAFIGGDMGISEAQMGTEAFDKLLAEQSAKYGPPTPLRPFRSGNEPPGSARPTQPPSQGTPYNPRAAQQEEPIRLAPTVNVPARPDYNAPSAPGEPIRLAPVVNVPPRPASPQRQSPAPAPSAARPIEPPSQGTPYNPQAAVQGLPDVPDAAAQPSYGEDPIAARKRASKDKAKEDADLQTLRDRWLSGATTGQSYREKLGGKNFKDRTPDEMADQYTGELWKRLNDGRLSQADYDKAVAGMDTDLNQSKARQAKIQQIESEMRKWEAATYGTFKGNGPPAEWRSHIQALQRLRTRAEAGDPAALAWNPKMKAPPPNMPATSRPDRGGFNNRKFSGLAGNARPTGYSWN
jgi:hypothetical protein